MCEVKTIYSAIIYSFTDLYKHSFHNKNMMVERWINQLSRAWTPLVHEPHDLASSSKCPWERKGLYVCEFLSSSTWCPWSAPPALYLFLDEIVSVGALVCGNEVRIEDAREGGAPWVHVGPELRLKTQGWSSTLALAMASAMLCWCPNHRTR